MSTSSTPLPNSTTTTTIDDLPEAILIHILSFLYIHDAIQTSLLSRRFRNLWHSIPSLHFDIVEFDSHFTSPNPRNCKFRLFAQFVSNTLSVRPSYPLTKFALRLMYTIFEQDESYVQWWIQNAITLSISELTLDFNVPNFKLCYNYYDKRDLEGPHPFYFRLSDIGESCISVLKLCKCHLMLPKEINPIKFASLKSLEIDTIGLLEKDVCNLLAQCLNLETLILVDIEILTTEGQEVLRIYSTSLKELYIKYSWRREMSDFLDSALHYDICCPSLLKISLNNLNVEEFTIKDMALLVEAWVYFSEVFLPEYKRWEKMLSHFTNISRLHLWDEVLEFNEVPDGCEQFASNVKHLELYCAYNENDLLGLSALLKLLPRLEILGLHYSGRKGAKLHENYWRASTVFNMPCLRRVILRKYQKTKGERHFIKLFRKNSTVLEKIELLPFSNMETEAQ